MSKSHSDKHERLDLGMAERRVVSAGAPAARNVLAVFLVFTIVFGLTFGLLFFADIKVGAAQVSESVAGADLPEADGASESNYSVADIAVSDDGTIEIGSLAGLLIASYAYNSNKSVADILSSKIGGVQNENKKSFKLVNNISGIFTAQDISALNAAFPSGWGKSAEGNGTLENVIKARAGDTLTILNSLFGDFLGTFDGNGYVINTFNLMGGTDETHKENAGFFATIEKDSTVKNLHLRNVNVVADGVTNVGGLAGTALSNIENVSVHGMFNVKNQNGSITGPKTAIGGIVGALGNSGNKPTLMKAIALGTIYANGYKFVGGAVGLNNFGGHINNVVSMMYIWSESVTLAGGISGTTENLGPCVYLKNSVWKEKELSTEPSDITPQEYSVLYCGSKSGYEDANHYYSSTQNKHPLYDALDDPVNMKTDDAPRESMRLCDLIDVYLLKYSLQEDILQVGDISYNVYKKSEKSWLVGNAKGTNKVGSRADVKDDPIIICNQQGVSLLRELRFATFKLTADVYLPASYKFETWQGAFFGKIYNKKTGENDYVEDGYHIYIKGYEGENIFELTPTNVRTVEFPVKAY